MNLKILPKKIYSLAEASELCKIPFHTLRRMCYSKEFPAQLVADRFVVLGEDLAKFMKTMPKFRLRKKHVLRTNPKKHQT